MKKLLVVLCGGLLAAGFSGCNEGGTSAKVLKSSLQQNKLAASQQVASDFKSRMALRKEMLKNNMEPNLNLGDGFDSRTGIGMGNNCLANASDPDAIQLSNPRASIDFTHTVSSQKIGDFLHTSMEGDADFGIFSASASAEYTRNSSDDRHAVNFNYLQTMSMDATYKIPGIGNKILDPDLRDLLENSGMNDFTNACGDSVIQSAKMGAILLVDASFNFASAAARDEFTSQAGGDFIFGGASTSVHNISENSRKNGTFSIRVLQLGGDPTKLANIFGDRQPGGYHVINCSLDTNDPSKGIAHCDAVANDVIGYAQKDFQTNVDFNERSTLYMFDYSTKPWSKLAVKAQLPILTDEQRAAREYLVDTITQDRRMLQYLQSYQQQSFWSLVDAITKDTIVKTSSDYQKMVNEYNNFSILDACYGDTENINARCVYAANQVKQMRLKYQNSIDVANNLTGIIAINTPIGNIKLITANGGCDFMTNQCKGSIFIPYNSQTHNFFTNVPCIVDTTSDNFYFKKYYPQFTGKTIFCYGDMSGTKNFYINRTNQFYNQFGIAGREVSGQQVNFDVPPYGYNAQFFYSEIDFKYNPI